MDKQQFIEEVRRAYESFLDGSHTLDHYLKAINQHLTSEIERFRRAYQVVHKAALAGESIFFERGPGQRPAEFAHEHVVTTAEALDFVGRRVADFPGLAYKMSYIYLVALYDAFLSDVVATAIRFDPRRLKSGKQITYEVLINLVTEGDSVLEYLVNREAIEFGFKSITEQCSYIKAKIGVDLSGSGEAIATLTRIRANRNILVHNSGKVNSTYKDLVPSSTLIIGAALDVNPSIWESDRMSLHNVVRYFFEKVTNPEACPNPVGGVKEDEITETAVSDSIENSAG